MTDPSFKIGWREKIPTRRGWQPCVTIAGLDGRATVGRKILFIQMLPAALAIIVLRLGW
ncbi:DUF1304 domain-containing protein [Mesorhizobium sp. B1-1-8]|uniref:DUF1304 domain-containing protein n=1 Tax=Mesorhizobium sp. B1-1-8 TaxID=2589976 RepID=UPI001D010B23|nr:DUF1304 domain-containing protein [Mesorhizobium sp. B1-1-8]UCI08547.1 DUF1304 domain-containing protein [Mesorhizobium sp. B1-1-8]